MARPGVMFYFDVRPCLKRLTDDDKGRLFEAILDYGEFGIIPEFDGMLGVAWDFIRPRLDRDAENYEKQVAQKQYAVFTREVKKKGIVPITFDQWKELSDDERDRLLSADVNRYPTRTTSPSITPSPSRNTKATGEGSGEGDGFTGKSEREKTFDERKRDAIALLQRGEQ